MQDVALEGLDGRVGEHHLGGGSLARLQAAGDVRGRGGAGLGRSGGAAVTVIRRGGGRSEGIGRCGASTPPGLLPSQRHEDRRYPSGPGQALRLRSPRSASPQLPSGQAGQAGQAGVSSGAHSASLRDSLRSPTPLHFGTLFGRERGEEAGVQQTLGVSPTVRVSVWSTGIPKACLAGAAHRCRARHPRRHARPRFRSRRPGDA